VRGIGGVRLVCLLVVHIEDAALFRHWSSFLLLKIGERERVKLADMALDTGVWRADHWGGHGHSFLWQDTTGLWKLWCFYIPVFMCWMRRWNAVTMLTHCR
jgi:hypothetical protein